MGNYIYIKRSCENEHFHRFYENGKKTIIICKNNKCITHMCHVYNCEQNMYIAYWKYNIYGKKTNVKICENNCSCDKLKCINRNYSKYSSDDTIYALPIFAKAVVKPNHNCNHNCDHNCEFDYILDFDD